mmetsp:Transcript_1280/g.1870  ORF Transcript_1280/g.1870 Transcript_1280/m.1870 type:complete len:267 (+) Transcript_1280:356-1156(+)
MGSFFSKTVDYYDFDFQTARNGVKVRKLTSSDKEAALNVFIRSFGGVGAPPEGALDWATGDLKKGLPLYEALSSKGPADRDACFQFLGNWMFSECLNYGFCLGIVDPNNKDALLGIALGRSPRSNNLNLYHFLMTMLRTRTLPPWTNQSGAAWERVGIKLDALKKAMNKAADEHQYYTGYYLHVLAVDPSCQGQGVGKALLQTISKNADRFQVPLFLETHGERNIAIYSRFGYKVESPLTVDLSKYKDIEQSDRKFVLMKRHPAAA